MSFTTNTSNLSGKSTTNAFDIVANSLTVNKNTLCKGDLTVLGTTNIGNVTLENAYVNYLTVNNFTAINPVPIGSGGTGLATIGTPNQVLTVNSGGTALIYAAPSLTNPSIITGTGFTGNPTLSLGLEADTGSLGRGFIRTGVAAVNGLFLGTASATVLRLWSNFATDSNAEIINTNANFTYNSTGSSGVFQVLSGGGGISFTNSGIGTISMATAAGNLSMAAGAGTISLTTGVGSTTITTGAGPISLTTGAGNISLTTAAAGIISLTVSTAGAINIGTALGAVNLYGSLLTLAAPAIYIGTALIPSVLVFACGDVTGVTGFWNITTLAFQLNAVSISLNSTLTIALNNNTTIGGYLSASGNVLANSGNLVGQSALNPAVTVYNFDGYRYGMDLGYNTTTLRYRTRIFCPNVGAGDIALSTSIQNATSQSNFTDRLVVRGDTGNIEMYSKVTVTNGNIITNQNIVGGVEIINNGNLALTSASPGNILIRGGSGSIITLPDATTLLVGYIYTINNNTSFPTIVNRFSSGTVGTVPALNAATVICTGTSSANGDWDINITGPTTATDWANPGQIGSAIPNTGVFTTLSCTSNCLVNSVNNANTSTLNPAITVYNNDGYRYGMDLGYNPTSLRFRTRIFCPNVGAGDIALSTSIQNATSQSNFTDRLVVRGDTGNIEMYSKVTVTNANIFTNQNIINGVIILNTGNVIPLSASSPGTILVRGGTGSIIILPDATTLIIGFTYTITNSTNSSVFIKNYFSQDVIGTIPALSAATVTCLDADFLNGFWDIHITGPSTIVNWGTPGQIGSTVPNTGAFTTLSASVMNTSGNVLANSVNTSNTTELNPSVTVYKTSSDLYGMDLGYSATTSRFRTRIFAPVGSDIALSTHTASPTSQSNFTDKLIINSTTGVINLNGQTSVTGTLEAINGNIITNQNIIGGVEIINSGNLSLSAASPGYILIKGGSGSTITLPNATTLIVGYIYTINNNTSFPTIVNRFSSGTVGTVPALNAATVICTGTSSANGDWDIHITGPTTATDWASPGQIGSAVPNTGAFTTLSATSSISSFSTGVFNVVNTNTVPLFTSTVLAPNIAVDNTIFFAIGKSLSGSNSAFLTFSNAAIPFSTWSTFNSTTKIDQVYNGNITLTAPTTVIEGILTTSNNLLCNSTNLASNSTLNPAVTVYNSAGYRYGMDLGYNAISSRYRTRIFCPNVGSGDIALSTSIQNATSQSNFTDRLVVRGDTGNIEMYSKVTVTNGNIITNQNIVGGVEIINNGNLALTAASPGNILIRGGSGSIITLPDATTLLVGYIYTINNNSNNPTIVNQHNSGTVGTVPALNAATVTCISTTSTNGEWDIHISGPTGGTDWATPGQIGSAIPNTGVFTTLSCTSNCLVNSVNNANTSTLNPAITVYNNDGYRYGMDLGYNATSLRFRTRIFCPSTGGGDIALSTSIQNPTGQSSFTDRLIVNGSNGEITLAAKTFVSASLSSFTTSIFNVENTSTAPNFTATVLAPSIAINQPIYFAVGKSLTSSNAAFLNFTNSTVPSSTWSMYNSTTKIDQAYNGNVTITAPITTVVGSLIVSGSIIGTNSSSSIYNANGLTGVSAGSWTNINFLFRARSAGNGFLTWIDQNTGLRNDTGSTVKLSVSFSCQRVSNTTGITALRILFADVETGVQDVTGGDAVSISANSHLAPSESLKCQIYQTNIGNNNVDYQNVYITVNLDGIS